MTELWCYLFMLPSLVLATLFTFWPIVASWYYSLLDWSGFTQDKTFVGLGNYVELFHDPFFWGAFGRSFLFMVVTVPVRLGLALAVAIVLNDQRLRLAPVFRTLLFIPVVTTTAIMGILMTFLLSPVNGPFNQILLALHLISSPISFLGAPETALWSVMGVSVWKYFGISLVYWLAALQAIPTEMYEAARVDGATRWQVHRYITAPLLVPFATVIVLITAVNTMRIFDLVETLTGGGPYFATEVMEVYIYRTAFSVLGGGMPRLGYASAAGVLFGICVMIIALGQGWVARQFGAGRHGISSGMGH
ncbi:MAG TPA: sugar ABC transporter permease [Chloroflexota bacterium]|nr:sugar ABC transporter permease [Chloroflexota bacterium]